MLLSSKEIYNPFVGFSELPIFVEVTRLGVEKTLLCFCCWEWLCELVFLIITLSYTTLLISLFTLPLFPLDNDGSQRFDGFDELFFPGLDSPLEQAIEQYINPLLGRNGCPSNDFRHEWQEKQSSVACQCCPSCVIWPKRKEGYVSLIFQEFMFVTNWNDISIQIGQNDHYLDLRQLSPHRHHNIRQTCNQNNLNNMAFLLSWYNADHLIVDHIRNTQNVSCAMLFLQLPYTRLIE